MFGPLRPLRASRAPPGALAAHSPLGRRQAAATEAPRNSPCLPALAHTGRLALASRAGMRARPPSRCRGSAPSRSRGCAWRSGRGACPRAHGGLGSAPPRARPAGPAARSRAWRGPSRRASRPRRGAGPSGPPRAWRAPRQPASAWQRPSSSFPGWHLVPRCHWLPLLARRVSGSREPDALSGGPGAPTIVTPVTEPPRTARPARRPGAGDHGAGQGPPDVALPREAAEVPGGRRRRARGTGTPRGRGPRASRGRRPRRRRPSGPAGTARGASRAASRRARAACRACPRPSPAARPGPAASAQGTTGPSGRGARPASCAWPCPPTRPA